MSPGPTKHAVLVLLLASYPMIAAAQADPRVEAGQHFDRGLTLAKQKAYVEAINEFNRAYQLSPHFSVMYNLGQAYLAIDQPVYAVLALRRYLAGGKDEIPPARRKQVEATIATQERRIATVTLHAQLAGVVVRVDGLEVGRTPLDGPLPLAVGSHRFDAFLPGYTPWEHKLDLAGQEQRTVEIRLLPVTVAPAATTAVPPAVPLPQPSVTPPTYPATAPAAPFTALPPGPGPAATATAAGPVAVPVQGAAVGSPVVTTAPNSRGRKIAAGIIGGVAVGSLAVGTVFGLQAFAKKSSSDDHCPHEQCTTEGVRLNDQAKTAATVSTVTFGVGLAAAAVATYLLLTPRAPSTSPAGTLAARVSVAPEIGSGRAGMALRGVW